MSKSTANFLVSLGATTAFLASGATRADGQRRWSCARKRLPTLSGLPLRVTRSAGLSIFGNRVAASLLSALAANNERTIAEDCVSE